MEVIQEASRHEVRQARKIVFLADIQEELQDLGEWALTLTLQTKRNDFSESWYVIATNRNGEEVTSQNVDNKGQHGHFVHRRNDTPKTIAASISNDRKRFDAKKAEAGK